MSSWQEFSVSLLRIFTKNLSQNRLPDISKVTYPQQADLRPNGFCEELKDKIDELSLARRREECHKNQ